MALPLTDPPRVVDAVVAGHVSLDVFPELHGPLDIAPGRLNAVGPATFSTGGAVSNTGLTLHRLGAAVRLVGKIGNDVFGQAVIDAYRRIDPQLADAITVLPDATTSYTIVINPPRVDRSFLHCSGANETFSAQDISDSQLARARLFHFGYPPLMPRMYADGGRELRALLGHAHDRGLATSLDLCLPDPDSEAGRADWHEVLENALPRVDVFAPSLDELLFMLDRERHTRLRAGEPLLSVVDLACLRELGERTIAMGAAIVAIKLGDHGLHLRTAASAARIAAIGPALGIDQGMWRDHEVLSPCFQPRRVAGTTGSGDATIGGLLMGLLRGADPTQAATTATAVGACSVESIDPTSAIPSWSELHARLRDGWPRLPGGLERATRCSAAEVDASGTLVFR